MARYDDTFVDRFLEPWNRHDARRQRQLIGGSLHLSGGRLPLRYPHLISRGTIIPKRGPSR
jgi:hypothetical protein